MVEPLRDEVVQKFGIDQLSVVQVETPKGEDHKLHRETQVSKATHTHTHANRHTCTLTAPTGKASTAIIQSLRPTSFLSWRSCSLVSPAFVSRLDTSIRTHRPKNTAWITCEGNVRCDDEACLEERRLHFSSISFMDFVFCSFSI